MSIKITYAVDTETKDTLKDAKLNANVELSEAKEGMHTDLSYDVKLSKPTKIACDGFLLLTSKEIEGKVQITVTAIGQMNMKHVADSLLNLKDLKAPIMMAMLEEAIAKRHSGLDDPEAPK